MNARQPRILVLSDMPVEARQIVSLLADDFPQVSCSTDENHFAADFDAQHPEVLLLAFRRIEHAERHALVLYRHSRRARSERHHSIVLCDKDNLRQAFELCRKECFDDYVLYWPLVYDSSRLHMSILLATRMLALGRERAAASEMLAHARVLGSLGEMLDAGLGAGKEHIDALGDSLQAARAAGDALATGLECASEFAAEFATEFELDLDGVPSGLAPAAAAADSLAPSTSAAPPAQVEPAPPPPPQPPSAGAAAVSVPPAALLARLRAHVGEASERAIPLTEWVDGLRREVSPQLDAARKLRGLAAQRPACVLVVDDDRFQCKLLERLLADFDCRLQFAHSGAEAFAALARERPELILMDVQLPDADGVAITRQLKANPALAGIPVIMITGHSERNILQASLAAGAVDFVVKPFERERMHAKLAKFLHGRGPG